MAAAARGCLWLLTDGGTTTDLGGVGRQHQGGLPLAAWTLARHRRRRRLAVAARLGAGAGFSASATTIGPVGKSGRFFSDRSSAALASLGRRRFLVNLDDLCNMAIA